jgi:hypothetical protein
MVQSGTLLPFSFCLMASAAVAAGTAQQAPRPLRPLRYHPDGADIVIVNGTNRFNRPLYGGNSTFSVYAGDLPEVLLSLPGKGGTLRLGIATPDASKWLSEAQTIEARYRAGAMRYEIHDALLGRGTITVDVVPMGKAKGAMIRVTPSPQAPAIDMVWAFGGASGYMLGAWNFDTARYVPESALLFTPADCAKNEFTITETGFSLRAPCHGARPVAGTLPSGCTQKVAAAEAMKSPASLWASTARQLPIVAGRRTLKADDPLLLAIEWLPEKGLAIEPGRLPAAMAAAEAHRSDIAGRVRINTPDAYMNAAVPAICSAADALWDPPVYVHGGLAWHMPYLGWRGAYIASEFGWHDRAKTHFRTFAAVQRQEPATAPPHADPNYNLARQAPDSTVNSRGGIPHHPVKGQPCEYDMQEVYIDQLLWHLMWTGDLDFAREMWPVLTAHLDWEKRCFDPDDDGLYENYANTMISDAHHYNGGACPQASAYNYRALRLAARLAKLLGKDPEPYQREADKTLAAMNQIL